MESEMDTLRIKSKFTKKLVAFAIEKAMKKALGHQLDVKLDPDTDFVVQIDDSFVTGHVSLDFVMERDALPKLLK